MKLNRKGMTLIEIMVTLVITSIVMLIAGGFILESMGYFDKTAKADQDKLAVDKIANLVRDELVYASEVRISDIDLRVTEPESQWHCLSLDSKGQLMKDDALLFNDDFYNKRTLGIQAKIYSNDYRVDMKFTFTDKNNKKVYSTSLTLEIINMKSHVSNNVFAGMTDISKGSPNYKIYYRNDLNQIEDSGNRGSGTVADEEYCVIETGDNKNFRGEFVPGTYYNAGDFVTYQGSLYKLEWTSTTSGNLPSEPASRWKKVSEDNSGGTYFTFDIILSETNDKYYQYVGIDNQYGQPLTTPDYWDGPYDTLEQLLSTPYQGPGGISRYALVNNRMPSYFKCHMPDLIYDGTVDDKDKKVTNIPDYSTGGFDVGDFVKYKGAVWIKIVQGSGGTAPGETSPNSKGFVWQKVQMDWDKTSAYVKGDVVRNGNFFFKATSDQIDGLEPKIEKAWDGGMAATSGWTVVRYSKDNTWEEIEYKYLVGWGPK